MSILPILLVISLILAGVFLSLFLWANKSGQFEDTFSPSLRVLGDEEMNPENQPSKNG